MFWGKIKRDLSRYAPLDFLRKVIFFMEREIGGKMGVVQSCRSLIYFKQWNVFMGNNVSLLGFSPDVKVAKGFRIYSNCCFELGHEASFNVGRSCVLSFGVIVSCRHKISIGDFVQIGEYTSLRDSTHNFKNLNVPTKDQDDIVGEIIIENNVWIGSGCILLPGTYIEEGVIVGAHSLVKGRLKKNSVYGGTPLRFLKARE